jgi:hypothetical protein
LIVASAPYLNAIETDVQEAAATLVNRSLLLIISSAYPDTGALNRHVLPSDARFQALLGGTRASLNIRVAQLLLQQGRTELLDLHNASQYLAEVLRRQPAIAINTRKQITDSVVKSFIKNALRDHSVPSATTLLRKLRESGNACEQARFRALYEETVNTR